jgi:hypothetical protein
VVGVSDFIETTRRYEFTAQGTKWGFEVPDELAASVLRMRELGAEHAAILHLAAGLQTDLVRARIALDVMSSTDPVGWDESLEAHPDQHFKTPQDSWASELELP